MNFFKVRLEYLKSFTYSFISIFISYFIKEKGVWLISERRNDAKDNGYCLYKYIRENYPSKKVIYAIDPKSNDFRKIEGLGEWVKFGSLRHHILYIKSSVVISSHMSVGKPGGLVTSFLEKKKIIKVKSVFLQHGITKDKAKFLYYNNSLSDLFVCGAKKEYDFVKEIFGYPADNVKYLGLCRFDNLHSKPKYNNQILIMPTWRNWLINDTNEFLESSFYNSYQALINNNRLIELLEMKDLNVIFYLHNDFQKYNQLFKNKCNRIIIAKMDSFDIQKLLKECNLLITDYSSVFFDFAYMMKPVIHYQFDYDEYRNRQYSQGYFDYNQDGFGPVIYDEDQLIDEIIGLSNKGFIIDEKYSNRIGEFFAIRDKMNCLRNYEAIQNLLCEEVNYE